MEAVAARRQFVAQLAVVVDLAVEREPAAGRSAHRLATGLGEIENLEAAMSEPEHQRLVGELSIGVEAAVDAPAGVARSVRSPMGQSLGRTT